MDPASDPYTSLHTVSRPSFMGRGRLGQVTRVPAGVRRLPQQTQIESQVCTHCPVVQVCLTPASSLGDRAATARYCHTLRRLKYLPPVVIELICARCSEPFQYSREDLLIAIPGQTERLSLVEASRPWRKGVNTFIALEKQLEEEDAPKGFLV